MRNLSIGNIGRGGRSLSPGVCNFPESSDNCSTFRCKSVEEERNFSQLVMERTTEIRYVFKSGCKILFGFINEMSLSKQRDYGLTYDCKSVIKTQ